MTSRTATPGAANRFSAFLSCTDQPAWPSCRSMRTRARASAGRSLGGSPVLTPRRLSAARAARRHCSNDVPIGDDPFVDSRIPLQSLLPDLDPTAYKAHCAGWNGEEEPLEVFARSRDEWAAWNSWRPGRDAFNRQFIFSMIQIYTERDRWLYGGTFEVVGRRPEPRTFSYDVEVREDVLPGCVGRLKLAFRLRGRERRVRFENIIDEIEVAELLPLPYAGQPFPGHDSINITLRQLETVYGQQ